MDDICHSLHIVKNPQIEPRKSICKRQDPGCPPMCGQGQGFATKRAICGGRGIILHTRQVETSSRALKLLAMESISHLLASTLYPCYAMYDLCY